MRDIVKHYDQIWLKLGIPTYLYALLESISALSIKKGSKVLDVACGNGALGEWLISSYQATVYGIDYSPVAAGLCEQKGYKVVKIVDLDRDPIPFEDNYFDLSIMSAVVEHIISPENVLKEVYNCLKPGGKLILLTPNISWIVNRILFLLGKWDHVLMGGTKGHISYMNKYLLESALLGSGFKSLNWKYSVLWSVENTNIRRNLLKRSIIRIINNRRVKYWESLWAFNFIVVASK